MNRIRVSLERNMRCGAAWCGHCQLGPLLARPGVHILLDRDADRLEDLAPGRFVTVHRLTSVPGCGVTVVRPDGYIGFRAGTAEAGQLAAWLALASAALVLAGWCGDLRASIWADAARLLARRAPSSSSGIPLLVYCTAACRSGAAAQPAC